MIKNTAFTLSESLIDQNNIIFNHKPYLIDLQSVGTQTKITNKDFMVKCYHNHPMSNNEFISQFFQPKKGTMPNIQTRMTILNRAKIKNGKDKMMKGRIKPKTCETNPISKTTLSNSNANTISKEIIKDKIEKKVFVKSTPNELFKMINGNKSKQIFFINTDEQVKNGTK